MNKKRREEAILNMIYGKDRINEIVGGENPDFKIRNKYHHNFFGVEITELYHSESQARLDNIPGYFDEILNNKRFRHKKDKKDLAVQQLTLQSDGKPDQQIEGIIQELPPITDYIQMIADSIIKKGARIQDYMQGLTHVNLIIYDRVCKLRMLSKSDFYTVFFTPLIRATLLDSEFREIFFITSIEKDANKWVYIPLKMLLFVSQIYLFDGALQYYYDDLRVSTPREELSLFAGYLYHIGAKGVYISDKEGEFEVICGNYGAIITDKKGLILRDHADYPLSNDARGFTDKDDRTLIDNTFIKHIDEFIQNNTFEGGCVFDVINPVQI